jgi:hypothetical protein
LTKIAGNIGAEHAGKRRNGGEKPGYARHPTSYARYFAFRERFRANDAGSRKESGQKQQPRV